LQFVKLRRGNQKIVDDVIACERRLAVQETLANIQNVSFRIVNNYDNDFEKAIQKVCGEIGADNMNM